MNHRVGMKHYGFEWYLRFGRNYRQEAASLRAHGVDFVVTQNLIDPLTTTAAAAGDVASRDRPALKRYDDRALREALRSQGVEYYEVLPMFFNPRRLDERPDLVPVGDDGREMRPVGWYVGLCPSDLNYLADRASMAEEVVARLRPRGLYLDWIRFPGFWELWTPDTERNAITEYCFCERCVSRFHEETGVTVRFATPRDNAKQILHEFRAQWTAWKCSLIGDAIATVKRAAQRQDPDIDVMTSNVAFGVADYDNAVEEILGQRIELFAQHADSLTFMFYHQIANRDPVRWVGRVTEAIEARTTRPFFASLQTKAAYLEAEYAAGGRRASIPYDEHIAALQAVLDSPADGVVVYHWSDYLEAEAVGDSRLVAALRAFKEGSLESLSRPEDADSP